MNSKFLFSWVLEVIHRMWNCKLLPFIPKNFFFVSEMHSSVWELKRGRKLHIWSDYYKNTNSRPANWGWELKGQNTLSLVIGCFIEQYWTRRAVIDDDKWRPNLLEKSIANLYNNSKQANLCVIFTLLLITCFYFCLVSTCHSTWSWRACPSSMLLVYLWFPNETLNYYFQFWFPISILF